MRVAIVRDAGLNASEDGLFHYQQGGCFWKRGTNPTMSGGIGSPNSFGTKGTVLASLACIGKSGKTVLHYRCLIGA